MSINAGKWQHRMQASAVRSGAFLIALLSIWKEMQWMGTVALLVFLLGEEFVRRVSRVIAARLMASEEGRLGFISWSSFNSQELKATLNQILEKEILDSLRELTDFPTDQQEEIAKELSQKASSAAGRALDRQAWRWIPAHRTIMQAAHVDRGMATAELSEATGIDVNFAELITQDLIEAGFLSRDDENRVVLAPRGLEVRRVWDAER